MADTPETPVVQYKPPATLVKATKDFSGESPVTITVECNQGDLREDIASLIAAFMSNNFKKNRVFLRMDERPSWSSADEGEQDIIADINSGEDGKGICSSRKPEPEYLDILVRAGQADQPTWTMDPPSYIIQDDTLMYLDAERKTPGAVPFLFPTEAFSYIGRKMAVTALALTLADSNGEVVVRLDEPLYLKPSNTMITAEQQIRKVIRNTEQFVADVIPAKGIKRPAAKLPDLTVFRKSELNEENPVEMAVHLSLAIDCIHHTIDYAITNIPLLRGKRSMATVHGLILELIDEPDVE